MNEDQDAALQKAGEEWLECVNAIIRRTAELGTPWTQKRAGSLIAVLAQAGYSYVKWDDLDEDMGFKRQSKIIANLTQENARVRWLLHKAITNNSGWSNDDLEEARALLSQTKETEE